MPTAKDAEPAKSSWRPWRYWRLRPVSLDPDTTNWQTVAESPTIVNNQFEVTVPLDQAERYFRLRKP